MKKLFFALFAIILMMGCDEDTFNFQEQLDMDVAEIELFLSENGINAIKDPSGVFYVISEEGTGTTYPDINSTVSMAYTGTLFDGTAFDSADKANPLKIPLRNVITGWQIGVPKFKKGAKGTLYIPSGYAYGRFGSGSTIPGNANLIFDVELLEFQ